MLAIMLILSSALYYAKFNLTMNRFIIDYENPDAGIGHSLGYINSAIKIATQHNLHFAFSPLQIKKSSSSDLQWRYKQFIRKITFRKIYETHDIGNDLNYLFAFDLLYSNRSSIEDKIKNGELKLLNLPFPVLKIPSNDQSDDIAYEPIRQFISNHPEDGIVFRLPSKRHADYEYAASRHLILNSYQKSRIYRPITCKFESNNINIAAHIRRGDLLPGRQYSDLRHRMLPDSWYEAILNTIISELSGQKITIHIFSEGINGNYVCENGSVSSWANKFSAANVLIKEWVDKPFIESFHHLLIADILIGSRSGMSHLAGILGKQIKIMPNMWHSYRGTDQSLELNTAEINSDLSEVTKHVKANMQTLLKLTLDPKRYQYPL